MGAYVHWGFQCAHARYRAFAKRTAIGALRAFSTRKARDRPKLFVLTNRDQIARPAKRAAAIRSRRAAHRYPNPAPLGDPSLGEHRRSRAEAGREAMIGR